MGNVLGGALISDALVVLFFRNPCSEAVSVKRLETPRRKCSKRNFEKYFDVVFTAERYNRWIAASLVRTQEPDIC